MLWQVPTEELRNSPSQITELWCMWPAPPLIATFLSTGWMPKATSLHFAKRRVITTIFRFLRTVSDWRWTFESRSAPTFGFTIWSETRSRGSHLLQTEIPIPGLFGRRMASALFTTYLKKESRKISGGFVPMAAEAQSA